MVNDFAGTLTNRSAARWLPSVALPGLLFLVTCWIGVQLGQDNALDADHLVVAVGAAVQNIAGWPVAAQALALVALPLTAVAVGLVVQALVGPVRAVSLGQWPRPLRPVARLLTRRRRRRWGELHRERAALAKVHPENDRTTEQQDRIDWLAGRINQIAMAEPGRPTWMGDRVRSLAHVAQHRYQLDLTFGWPRLWLVLPDTARKEIARAQGGFAAAVLVTTWALPYLALGALWWPAALAGMVIAAVGWSRARMAISTLTGLAEAALDMHSRSLAIALGVADSTSTGPVTPDEGRGITEIVRKGR